MEMQSKSSQIPTFLPRNFNTCSTAPEKLVSSFVALVRPLDSPQSPPWMVLSAEPCKGVTQLFNPFTRTPVENLDLTKFRTTILATECHIVDDEYGYGLFCSGNSFYVKALMLSSVRNSIENCLLFATFDDGVVGESQPFDGRHTYFQKGFYPSYYSYFIDDIINYKGEIYALDKREALLRRQKRQGYCVNCNREFHFCKEFVRRDYGYAREYRRRRKRLVVSSSGETLYMVDPCIVGRGKRPSEAIEIYFIVYELDSRSRSWRRVSSLKDGDDVEQVLFVTRDYCFFVAATEFPGCQLRNCIIFSDDAFPLYKGDAWDYPTKGSRSRSRSRTTEVAIFSLDDNLTYSMPVKTYPGFPVMLCSPPPWILHNNASSNSQSGAEKDEMAQSAFDSKQDDNVLSIVGHGQSDSLSHLTQPLVNEIVTLKKFQGIDVLPDHLPVLENVWMKHGDVLGGIAICSRDTKSMALTYLAKILLILERSNGNILAKDQAQYLDSTFNDLQYMHLKVDWLAPSVKKALATYKREQLQLMELDKAKLRQKRWSRSSSFRNWIIILMVTTAFIFCCAILLLLSKG